MTDLHRHRCGYGGFGRDDQPDPDNPGCGLVVEHDPDAGSVSHVCTNCGVVTTWRYFGLLNPGEGMKATAPPPDQLPIL